MISTGVMIVGGTLTGIALDPEARDFALQQLQGRTLPVPGLPMTLRLDPVGPDRRLMFNLDLGALLPAAWGFRSQ